MEFAGKHILAGHKTITPPGQEGWREAPGWLFYYRNNFMWFMDFSLRKIQGALLRILNNHPGCGEAAAAPPVQEGRLPSSPRALILTPSKFRLPSNPYPTSVPKISPMPIWTAVPGQDGWDIKRFGAGVVL